MCTNIWLEEADHPEADEVLNSAHNRVASVDLCGVTFWRCGKGVHVVEGCEADIEKCTFTDLDSSARGVWAIGMRRLLLHEQCGVHLTRASRAQLRGCSFDLHTDGVRGQHVDGLQVLHCDFRCSDADCACVQLTDCLRANMEDCSFSGSSTGLQARGSWAALQRCGFGEAVALGVRATGASQLLVHACEFSGCDVGMVVSDESRIHAGGCMLLGLRQGMVLKAGGTLTAKQCKMDGGSVLVEAVRHYRASVKTQATLTDCQLSNAGMGLRVWGFGAAATLQRCDISGCDVGLYMADAVAVGVTDCSISRCAWGMLVGLRIHQVDAMDLCCACGREGQCAWNKARQSIAKPRATRSREQPNRSGGKVARKEQCVHQGAVARLRVERADVRHCKHGVRVNEFGLLEAVGLRVDNCAQGVRVVHIERRSGECCTLKESEGCGEGSNVMRVWPRGVVEEAGCTECDVPGLAVRRVGG